MAVVELSYALVNVCTIEWAWTARVTKSTVVRKCLVAVFARAGEAAFYVRANCVCVTIVPDISTRTIGRAGTLVDVKATEPIASIPRNGAGAVVPTFVRVGCKRVQRNVGAVGSRVAQIVAGTLINIGAGDPITAPPSWALACERSLCVRAPSSVKAVVRSQCALINLRARVCGCLVARLTSALSIHEVR